MNLKQRMDEFLESNHGILIPKEAHLYPSEASVKIVNKYGETEVLGNCLRKSYFRFLGKEREPFPARVENIFGLGRAAEDYVTEIWKQMGLWVANSVRWQLPEINVSGEVDVVLKNPDTQGLIGVEVKSVHGYFAESEIFGNTRKVGKPKPEHLLQTLVYRYAFPDFEKFIIFYIMRDTGKTTAFDVDLVAEEIDGPRGIVHYPKINNLIDRSYCIEDVIDRYKKLNTAIKNGIPPAADFLYKYSEERINELFNRKDLSKSKYEKWQKCNNISDFNWPGDWNCGYCPYVSLCWTEDGQPKVVQEEEDTPDIILD